MKQGDEKSPKSGRYRKVGVRIWGDEKFRALSPIPPCGQGLFLYLLTGPHTGPVPGLFRAGRAALAEELGWEQEAFDKAFAEAFRERLLKADSKARVICIPKAIKHNKPESPNVVKSWSSEFDLIPECDLKREAFEVLKASIHALGEAYGKAFDESFGKAFAKASPKTSPNQEQEQEQEQKSNTPPPPKGGKSRRSVVGPNLKNFESFDAWYAIYRRKEAKLKAQAAWVKLDPDADLTARIMAATKAWPWPEDKTKIPHPASWLNGRRWEDETVAVAVAAVAKAQANAGSESAPAGQLWWQAAGFDHPDEAANFGCREWNAAQYRDGKRVEEAQA